MPRMRSSPDGISSARVGAEAQPAATSAAFSFARPDGVERIG